jgi:hypothetical protein
VSANRGGFVPLIFELLCGQVALIKRPMIHGARFVIITAIVLCPLAQPRAEDKEPFAVIELGAAAEQSIREGTYSVGPSARRVPASRCIGTAATGN